MWGGNGATNIPACYIGGCRPQVWVRFAAKPDGLGGVQIGANAVMDGFPLGNIPVRVVSFVDGDSDWVSLPACDGTNTVPTCVDIAVSKWNWYVDAVRGYFMPEPFVFSSTGPHKVYTVLDYPKDPWRRYPNSPQCAWSFALERVCAWAKGSTSTNEALAAVTSNLFYNCGLKYDVKDGRAACLARAGTFDLTKYIMRCPGDPVNCFDQAHAVFLLGNLLGADVHVKRIMPFGYLKRTQLVGRGYTNNPFYGNVSYDPQACCDRNAVGRSSFYQHFFAMSGEWVFDSCAGPALGTTGLAEYLQAAIDSERSPAGSRPGTTADVVDYVDVRFFE